MSIEIEDNIVIIINLGNYKTEYQEPTPFKAKVLHVYHDAIEVRSQATDKKYEVYDHQILECLSIEEITQIDLSGNH